MTMPYAIISEDVTNSLPLRQSVRPAHIERLEQLKQLGRLILAGPHPAIDSDDPGDAGFTGSLVVAEFTSLYLFRSPASRDGTEQSLSGQAASPPGSACGNRPRYSWL